MRFLTILACLSALIMAAPPAARAQAPEQGENHQPEPQRGALIAVRRSFPVTPPLTPETTWHLDLSTGGRVTIQLRADAAPQHVERIRTLTRQGFYNGLIFHRVIEGFMAQGGDPSGNGMGGSQLPDLDAEISGLPHARGSVGMARAQAMNSANSQFYIMFTPRLQMDNEYTVIGRVVGGMNFVDAIARGEPPVQPTRIVRASIGADNVPPPSIAELTATPAAPPATAAAPARGGARVGPAIPRPQAGPRQLEPVRAPNARPAPPRQGGQ